MKTFVAAFAVASLLATSAWARTESGRQGALTSLRADRALARPPAQHYALMLGVAF